MSRRTFCYVQHLMGIGHQRRAAAISRALCALGMEVTYVSGGFPVPDLDPGSVRFIQLPPARSQDMFCTSLVDENGVSVDADWQQSRRAQLLEAFSQCHPHVLLTETFPFGRRLLRFELLPLLQAAVRQSPRAGIVCSVRDILERRSSPARDEEIVSLVQRFFDRILVHSDPMLVPFEASFPFADRIRERLCYTGYVSEGRLASWDGHSGRGEVLVSVGGGGVGERLLRTALAARPLSALAHAPWRLLVGHHLPKTAFDALATFAPAGVIVERNRPDFNTLLEHCAVSVSQAGYNTVLDVLSAGARAVLVPYCDQREQEQLMRARLLRERGFVSAVVAHSELDASRLAAAIDAAYSGPGPKRFANATAGAKVAAEVIAEVAARSRVPGEAMS